MAQAPDCQTCGACCVGGAYAVERGAYADVDEDEAQTIPADLLAHADGRPDFHAMRIRTDGRCAALEGAVGSAVHCTIYDQRPRVCRVFRPGSEECWDARYEERVG